MITLVPYTVVCGLSEPPVWAAHSKSSGSGQPHQTKPAMLPIDRPMQSIPRKMKNTAFAEAVMELCFWMPAVMRNLSLCDDEPCSDLTDSVLLNK